MLSSMKNDTTNDAISPQDALPRFEFYPFFDPWLNQTSLGGGAKLGISFGLGLLHSALQLLTFSDPRAYFEQYCWVLSLVISGSLLALYIATEAFRRSLAVLREFDDEERISRRVLDGFLSNRRLLGAGLIWAAATMTVALLLGIPTAFPSGSAARLTLLSGYGGAGFISGMGLLAVIAVIVLHLRIAPHLPQTLDPDNPDGSGGFRAVGNSLWYFAFLVALVALLVSFYMLRIEWTNLTNDSLRTLFVFWMALPYLFAISVVLIPGLVVRRQVQYFKNNSLEQLKQEKSKLFSSFKRFESDDDDAIIASKKELTQKIDEVQERMVKLKSMRASPIDGKRDT